MGIVGSAQSFFLFVVLEGFCPKGNDWSNFESRCFYWPKSLKLSLSKAIAACRREGAQLLHNVYTDDQRYQVAFEHGEAVHYQKNALWTGIKDHSYHLDGKQQGVRYKFLVKPCGNNTSLLYNGYETPPSCDASHLFMCEIEKGECNF